MLKMAAVSRRRRFFVLLLICCVTYLLFSWFIKSEDFVNENELFLTGNPLDVSYTAKNKAEQDFLEQIRAEETADDTFTLHSRVTSEVQSVAPDFVEKINPVTVNNDKRLERLERLKKLKNLPSNLFDFHPDVTFNPELEPSGPTEDDDSLYMKGLIEKSGVTSSIKNPVTPSYVRLNDIEEYSGPPVSEVITTIPPTSPSRYPNSKEKPDVKSSKNNKIKHQDSATESFNIKPTKNPALIIDTPGCKIPKMDPFDPSVKDLISIKDVYLCHEKPMFMTAQPHGIIHLNVSVLKEHYNATPDDMACFYQAILRKHEKPGNVRENDYKTTDVMELKFDTPLEYEYIAAKCYFNESHTHEQYLPLVKLKDDVEKNRTGMKPSSPLNVVLLGIDSVSKLNFMRHFKKVKTFLDKIKPFDMKGYTKVGDNTFPNLVPLLTGHFVEYYWNESVRDTFVFDKTNLIWKDYAKKGFRTFYAEDSPYTGTFNYIKRGFYDPPTDYYLRPLAMAIENSALRQKNKKSGCLNNELDTDIIYDYLTNFVKTMDKKPFIGFAMVSTLTHDFLNSASYADPPAARNLQDLYDAGVFNTSMVVLFSDHGLRFGQIRHTYIGKFEERMPFMYINFPEWFLEQNPQYKRNIDINQDRLITLFDVHATMKHLLDLNGYRKEVTDELGLSLLEEIPATRTCEDANILQHWCPCNNFDPVSVTDPAVINASQAIVDHINNLLSSHSDICETLEVAEVTDSRLGLPNEIVLKFERHENVVENRTVVLGEKPPLLGDYLITLTVKPGGAIFEGTVRYDSQNAQSKVMGISRINMYRKTSHCINSQKLKIYCYCKQQLTTGA